MKRKKIREEELEKACAEDLDALARQVAERVIQREFRGTACDRKSLDRYVKDILQPHISVWDEAILCATIWFLDTELGIRRIFYHTFDSGNRLEAHFWQAGATTRALRNLYLRAYEVKIVCEVDFMYCN
jgi:hypothetical protein